MVDRDSQDNAYFMDFFGSYIGRIDAKTGETTMFATPTKDAFPRRGFVDAQDRGMWNGVGPGFLKYQRGMFGHIDEMKDLGFEWDTKGHIHVCRPQLTRA